jgi:hypothetical protein
VRWAASFAGLALALVASAAQAREVSYTIAIGNNAPPSGRRDLAPLRYADDDAARYLDLFGRLPGRSWLLAKLDRQTLRRRPGWAAKALPPTLAELRRRIAEVAKAIAADKKAGNTPVVFITYSGHGAVDDAGEYYLTLADGGLTRAALYDQILAPLAEARVHLFVDSCNAEGVVGSRGAFDREVDATSVPLSEADRQAFLSRHGLARFPNVGVLLASTTGQEAHEWSQIESGVFTYEITSALLGAADVNGDLRIEYSEVAAFVAAANRAIPNPDAVPELVARAPAAASSVILDLTALQRTQVLTGRPKRWGKFHIELQNGSRWLGAHLTSNGRMALALPQENGMYLRVGEREAEIPNAPSRVVELDRLRLVPSQVASRGSIAHTLREGLFAKPFDVLYYKSFVRDSGLGSVAFAGPRPIPAEPTAEAPVDYTLPAVLGTTAAVATAAALVSSFLAVDAYGDFQDEERQRQASDLRDDVTRYQNIAIGAGALGVVAGVGTWLSWPSTDQGLTARGPQLEFRGRF